MFLMQREAGSNDGWEFVAYVENCPYKLVDATKEYRWFFISNEL
jgi:hypothetical protein